MGSPFSCSFLGCTKPSLLILQKNLDYWRNLSGKKYHIVPVKVSINFFIPGSTSLASQQTLEFSFKIR